jgi:hypothetical protein
MRNESALALLLALSVTGAIEAADVGEPSCGVEREAMPLANTSTPCVTALGALQICQTPVDSAEVTISLRQGDREIQRWRAGVMGVVQGNFRVLVADLNGDGVDDVAIATHHATSNGMAISFWTVCAVNGATLASPPACVEVEDYGSMGYFTKQPGTAGCLLLQTAWRHGKEPSRGEGLYLVGRWLRYSKTGFVAEPSRPLIARRYLYSFAREIGSHGDMPYAWFRDARTKTVSCPDPLCQ